MLARHYVCYNTPAHLHGIYTMAPVIAGRLPAHLNNSNTINPIAFPPRTTTYILTVYDTLGCPKPGHDSVL